jgi:hypothetical protein
MQESSYAGRVRAAMHGLAGDQASITAARNWLLNSMNSKQAVETAIRTWEDVLFTVPSHKKVLLVYLCNDMLQWMQIANSINYLVLHGFYMILKDVMWHVSQHCVRSDKMKVQRVVSIWLERSTFAPSFCNALKEKLGELNTPKATKTPSSSSFSSSSSSTSGPLSLAPVLAKATSFSHDRSNPTARVQASVHQLTKEYAKEVQKADPEGAALLNGDHGNDTRMEAVALASLIFDKMGQEQLESQKATIQTYIDALERDVNTESDIIRELDVIRAQREAVLREKAGNLSTMVEQQSKLEAMLADMESPPPLEELPRATAPLPLAPTSSSSSSSVSSPMKKRSLSLVSLGAASAQSAQGNYGNGMHVHKKKKTVDGWKPMQLERKASAPITDI